MKYAVASVCIKPYAVKRAAELLRGTGVRVEARSSGSRMAAAPPNQNDTKPNWPAMAKTRQMRRQWASILGKAIERGLGLWRPKRRTKCDEARRHGASVKFITWETDFLANGSADFGGRGRFQNESSTRSLQNTPVESGENLDRLRFREAG